MQTGRSLARNLPNPHCRPVVAAWLGAFALAAVWPSARLLAQSCTSLQSQCEDHRPEITISPTGGTFLDSRVLAVTITWRDDRSLDGGSHRITVTGGTISSAFDYTVVSAQAATSAGEITLAAPGETTITAHICDYAPQCQDGGQRSTNVRTSVWCGARWSLLL